MISMTPESQSILDDLLKLPLDQRVAVAQALWESIDDSAKEPQIDEEEAFMQELMRRDAEMDAGINVMTREEFMAAVHQERACRSASTPAPGEK